MRLAFILGQTPDLSIAEIVSVWPTAVIFRVRHDVLLMEVDELDPKQALSRLGGTVKIVQLIEQLPASDHDTISSAVVTFLSHYQHPEFAVAEIGRDHLPVIEAAAIKDALKTKNVASRYRSGSRKGLSAAVLVHDKVVEVVVLQTESGENWLGYTAAVQEIDDWSLRDRGKPYADRKKGMLPPKVARMLLNIGLGDADPSKQVVYDPFCGTGTVLLEAAVLKSRVIGSDQDAQAVQGTKTNIEWLLDTYQLSPNLLADVFVKDVTSLNRSDFTTLPTIIVTEPFLGRQTPPPTFVPQMMRGLEKLYVGAFKRWSSVLPNGGKVVIVFPAVTVGHMTYSMQGLIDKLITLGYTTDLGPITYQRPGAIVARQVYRFTKQPNHV